MWYSVVCISLNVAMLHTSIDIGILYWYRCIIGHWILGALLGISDVRIFEISNRIE